MVSEHIEQREGVYYVRETRILKENATAELTRNTGKNACATKPLADARGSVCGAYRWTRSSTPFVKGARQRRSVRISRG